MNNDLALFLPGDIGEEPVLLVRKEPVGHRQYGAYAITGHADVKNLKALMSAILFQTRLTLALGEFHERYIAVHALRFGRDENNSFHLDLRGVKGADADHLG